jgi:hypothetical protein
MNALRAFFIGLFAIVNQIIATHNKLFVAFAHRLPVPQRPCTRDGGSWPIAVAPHP